LADSIFPACVLFPSHLWRASSLDGKLICKSWKNNRFFQGGFNKLLKFENKAKTEAVPAG